MFSGYFLLLLNKVIFVKILTNNTIIKHDMLYYACFMSESDIENKNKNC